ncbi:MAG: phenylalanine--tRNA ligase subunit alpha [Pirellulales bacterium]|nr:phenylalanine--tRNA ligase subunit alpha [Pirellulales bacterium]
MALQDFLADLAQLASDAQSAFANATDFESLEVTRIEFLGAKGGRLRIVQKGLGNVDSADKPAAGKRLNEVKRNIEDAFRAAKEKISSGTSTSQRVFFDPTLPGTRLQLGGLHPITQTIEHMKEIMGRLGFTAVDGPEIEDDWHNFEALNIPYSHPARDPLDNFYLTAGARSHRTNPHAPVHGKSQCIQPMLLRSQTSTVQIRVMEKTEPPVRIVSLGRVYRPDTADATHYPMFHQIEGLLVDRRVTMADLKSVIRLFCQDYFGDNVRVRFRPSFFPFTEPSVEVDMNWEGGWMEMGGAGMVDPNVLEAVGYPPDEVTGFAFGLGVERICMRQHGITDIRDLYQNDVRFLRQF